MPPDKNQRAPAVTDKCVRLAEQLSTTATSLLSGMTSNALTQVANQLIGMGGPVSRSVMPDHRQLSHAYEDLE